MNALMIETKDNRRFFTHEEHFAQLVEFSKTFGAAMSTVRLEEGPVLDLEELAPAICDPGYERAPAKYEVIERRPVGPGRTRAEVLRTARSVRSHILGRLRSAQTVSTADLKKKYKRQKLSDSALAGHIRSARAELAREGLPVVRVAAGEYRVSDGS